MTDSDIALAKKRHVRDLRIIFIVQVVALCITGLGFFLTGVVPNDPWLDEIHLLCIAFTGIGMVIFAVALVWGVIKLVFIDFAYPLDEAVDECTK
jgi:hypothetical protein